MAEAQARPAAHYTCRGPVAGMVARAGLPERTFSRRFRKATGLSPIECVQALRTEEAKQLLERTSLPADLIAAEVGYENPVHFRRVFRRLVGETPGQYRRRFAPVARPGSAQPRCHEAGTA